MSALQAALLFRPLPSPTPSRRRLPISSASVHFPRAPAHRRAPPCLRALAPDAPQPAPEPPAAAVGSAAEPEAEPEPTAAAPEASPAPKGELEGLVDKAKAWVVAVAAAVVAAVRRFFDWVVSGDWMSWWPFWRPDRRLQRLIEDADANPNDAVKQSALLHELNKSRCAGLHWNWANAILIQCLFVDCVVGQLGGWGSC